MAVIGCGTDGASRMGDGAPRRARARRGWATVAALLALIWATAAVACPDWRRSGERLAFGSDALWVPQSRAVMAGGGADLERCPQPGVGHVATTPDFTLRFSGNAAGRDLLIRVEGTCDTVLLVNDAAAQWHFNDDFDGLDPALLFEAAAEGIYDIWVGTFGPGMCAARLVLETFGTPPAGSSGAETSGSGFFVNREGWVLTNAHVVEGCGRVEIAGHGPVAEIVRDRIEDLAALRLERPAPVAPLAFRAGRARLAEPVHAIGYPLSDILSPAVRVTSGSVNALSGFGRRENLIQISSPVQPGNSGGPVIDGAGHVLGVLTATLSQEAYDRAQNVNFALPASEAMRFLRAAGIAHDEAKPEAAAADISDVVEAAAASTVLIRCLSSRAAAPAPAPVRTGMVVRPGLDVIGFDYRRLRDSDATACQSACEADPRCRAFTFNRRHAVCFLKEDAALLVQNPDAIGGHARALSETVIDTGFKVLADTDSPGGDYARSRDSDFIACFLDCATETRCLGFAYVRRTRDCWLKDRIGTRRSMPGVELGLR